MLSPPVERVRRQLAPWVQWRLLIGMLIVSDLSMMGFAFRLAHFVRFNLNAPFFDLQAPASFPTYRTVSLFILPLWLGIFTASGLYERRNLLGGTQEYSLVFRAASVGMFLVIVVGFLEPGLILARGWLILSWLFVFFLVGAARFGIRRIVYGLRRRGYFLTPALIVGANEEGQSLAQQLLSWRTSGLHVVGFVDNRIQPGTVILRHLQSLGQIAQLDQLIRRYNIEELILATSAVSRKEMLAVFKKYGLVDGLNLRLSSGLFEIITTGLEVRELADTPLVRVQKVRLTGVSRVLKLLLDYAITIPGIIAIGPLLVAIAVAIKLDSPGPVLHRRRVMGLNGCQFDAYKFRTMYVDGVRILAEHPSKQAELLQTHKIKDDPRVTRVGRLLRRASLDELPQAINVLLRQMSLVGPRMISPEEMRMYDDWGLNLLTVLPGITGLWQVSGRSDVSYDQRVRLDMHYIRSWSIWLDLQILWQTIPAIIEGRGAY